jgi:hypothetical protein
VEWKKDSNRMSIIRLIGLLCLVLFVFGCAIRPKFITIDNPENRIVLQGYSLTPTNEPGWVIAARSSHQLALAKQGVEADETFAIQATLLKLPSFNSKDEFLDFVRAGQEADSDPSRFTMKKHDVVSYKHMNTDCARSHLLAVDNAAAKRRKNSGDMLLEMATLACTHPDNKRVGISVVYSQRYYPNQKTAGFMSRADEVLESVEIENIWK